MNIEPVHPTSKNPPDQFAGDAWVDLIAAPHGPQQRAMVVKVRFAPGTRTAWHSHERGQYCHVTEGVALFGDREGNVFEVHPGQTLYTPAGTTALARGPAGHLHGAHRRARGRRRPGHHHRVGRAHHRRGIPAPLTPRPNRQPDEECPRMLPTSMFTPGAVRTEMRLWASVLAAAVLTPLSACSGLADGGNGRAGATQTSAVADSGAAATPTAGGAQSEGRNDMEDGTLRLTVGDAVLTATLADNTSVEALKQLLADGPVTIDMRDYKRMEKVGPLGADLPRNDEQITTEPGDLILYQGNALVIYYAPNTWEFTRLGHIDGVTAGDLKRTLGPGDVRVTLSLDPTP